MKLLTVLLAFGVFLGGFTPAPLGIDQAMAACPTHDLKCKEEEEGEE